MFSAINQSLQWRHNDHDSVSNHQPHGCLLNRLFRRRSKKTSNLRVTGLCVGKSPGTVNSPHKGPVTRKMFPFNDVSMVSITSWVHIHDRFSIVIPILRKIHYALIWVVVKRSLWNFAHGITAVLSWEVQICVAIWYPTMDVHWNQFSMEYELRWKYHSWNGPLIRYWYEDSFIGKA